MSLKVRKQVMSLGYTTDQETEMKEEDNVHSSSSFTLYFSLISFLFSI